MTETTVYGIESASHWDCSVFNKEHGHNFGHILFFYLFFTMLSLCILVCVYQPKFECQSKSLKCKQDPELTVLCYVNKDWPMHYTSCFDLQLPYKPPPLFYCTWNTEFWYSSATDKSLNNGMLV